MVSELPVRRHAYVALALGTIGVGLLVHLGGIPLGATARDVTGDVLWATMLSWWVGAIVPRAGLVARSLASYGVCILVEVSQLWRAPILDAARETQLGHLVLGSGFDARDLLAYALGVAVALLLETAWRLAATEDRLQRCRDDH